MQSRYSIKRFGAINYDSQCDELLIHNFDVNNYGPIRDKGEAVLMALVDYFLIELDKYRETNGLNGQADLVDLDVMSPMEFRTRLKHAACRREDLECLKSQEVARGLFNDMSAENAQFWESVDVSRYVVKTPTGEPGLFATMLAETKREARTVTWHEETPTGVVQRSCSLAEFRDRMEMLARVREGGATIAQAQGLRTDPLKAADAMENGGVACGSDGEWVSVRRHVRDEAVAALRDRAGDYGLRA